MEQLKDSIDCLQQIEVGINTNPSESYNLSLITEFNSWDDLKSYANHPEHLKVAGVIREILEQRACVDYELTTLRIN